MWGQTSGKDPQMDCCVNSVMAWYDKQVPGCKFWESSELHNLRLQTFLVRQLASSAVFWFFLGGDGDIRKLFAAPHDAKRSESQWFCRVRSRSSAWRRQSFELIPKHTLRRPRELWPRSSLDVWIYIYVIWMGHCPVILSTPVIGHHTSRKDSFWIDQSCNSCISFGLLAGVTLWISCRMPCWRCTGINATRAIRINGYHFFYWVPSFVFVVIDQLYKSCSHEAGFPVPTGRTPHCPVPCSPWTIQINARRGQWLV